MGGGFQRLPLCWNLRSGRDISEDKKR